MHAMPSFRMASTLLFLLFVSLVFLEAKEEGVHTKPVILGPVTYLLLGKEKEAGFHRLDLLRNILPVYKDVLNALREAGADYVQLDEPCLVLDLDERSRQALREAYAFFREECPGIRILLATYFGGLYDNLPLACSLPVDTLLSQRWMLM